MSLGFAFFKCKYFIHRNILFVSTETSVLVMGGYHYLHNFNVIIIDDNDVVMMTLYATNETCPKNNVEDIYTRFCLLYLIVGDALYAFTSFLSSTIFNCWSCN